MKTTIGRHCSQTYNNIKFIFRISEMMEKFIESKGLYREFLQFRARGGEGLSLGKPCKSKYGGHDFSVWNSKIKDFTCVNCGTRFFIGKTEKKQKRAK